jgi:hypothetical protein
MATSPNYSWPEPDNTDLVKNGALAIRTMGNAIDTTMATMTPKSTYTAKGSIAAATGASTPANLSVGNNGETLVADSSTSTGLRYNALFGANKNKIINGDFYINQRNFTSNTANATFNFDRWYSDQNGGTVTITPQVFTPGAAPVAGYEGANFVRVAISGQSGSHYASVSQKIEDVRNLAGQTITVSFWAKANTGTPSIGPIVFQRFGTGGSAGTANVPTAKAITTSWARYSWTLTMDSLSGKTIGTGSSVELELMLSYGGGAMGINNNTFDVWGVQVEAGNVATPFQTATGTLQGELAACQRYYWRATAGTAYGYLGFGGAFSITQANIFINAPVNMRIAPTAVDYPTISTIRFADGVQANALTALALDGNSTNNILGVQITSTALTLGRVTWIQGNNSASAYVGFTAEL